MYPLKEKGWKLTWKVRGLSEQPSSSISTASFSCIAHIRQATERVRVQDRYETVSRAFYQLRKMVEYKANLNGAKVIAVDPRYTS